MKLNKYKCGHRQEIIILDSNILSHIAYDEWVNSIGFKGDNSMCWECFCKKSNEVKKMKCRRCGDELNDFDEKKGNGFCQGCNLWLVGF